MVIRTGVNYLGLTATWAAAVATAAAADDNYSG